MTTQNAGLSSSFLSSLNDALKEDSQQQKRKRVDYRHRPDTQNSTLYTEVSEDGKASKEEDDSARSNSKRSTLYHSPTHFRQMRVYGARGENPRIMSAHADKPKHVSRDESAACKLYHPIADVIRPFLLPAMQFTPKTPRSHAREGRPDLWMYTMESNTADLKGVAVWSFGADSDACNYDDLYISHRCLRTLVKSGFFNFQSTRINFGGTL